jgi:hypothetical protein
VLSVTEILAVNEVRPILQLQDTSYVHGKKVKKVLGVLSAVHFVKGDHRE